MKPCFPDYTNCSVNIVNSIASYCGAAPKHPTHAVLDAYLSAKKYKNIILMLFDGMGVDMLEKNLPEDAFLRRHMAHTLSSVFPSTTTCSTTSFETGLMPCEHAWLGWTLYFPQIDQLVDVFTNKNDKNEAAADYYVGNRYIPRDFIYAHIEAAGQYKALSVSPFGHVQIKTISQLFDNVLTLSNDAENRYIYAYWPEPDSTMHHHGCYHEKTKKQVEDINRRAEELYNQLPDDTLLLITADHGLVDTKMVYLEDYPSLYQMLVRDSSIELRATSFTVKPECLADFPAVFRACFPDHFLLVDGKTFIRDYLGHGDVHPAVYDFVGDYVALATGPISIMNHPGPITPIGNHAGLTREEMVLPLILAKK